MTAETETIMSDLNGRVTELERKIEILRKEVDDLESLKGELVDFWEGRGLNNYGTWDKDLISK